MATDTSQQLPRWVTIKQAADYYQVSKWAPAGRTVMGEDSAVVTCCGRPDHGVMMGWFVVVDPA